MPIEIRINGDTASEALRELTELSRGLVPTYIVDPAKHTVERLQSSTVIAEQEVAAATERGVEVVGRGTMDAETGEVTLKRERGQPSPGKARRTKAEIAEDTAYFADHPAGEAVDESGESSGMSISSGEERISPEDEADHEADAADETAETEANGGLAPRDRLRRALGSLGIKAGVAAVQPGGLLGMTVDQVPEDEIEAAIAKLEAFKRMGDDSKVVLAATKDDLMQAMLDYAEIFDGTRSPADAKLAQVDAGKVFELLFGEGVNKLSAVPSDGYDKAIAGMREAIAKNPFKRTRQNG